MTAADGVAIVIKWRPKKAAKHNLWLLPKIYLVGGGEDKMGRRLKKKSLWSNKVSAASCSSVASSHFIFGCLQPFCASEIEPGKGARKRGKGERGLKELLGRLGTAAAIG